MSYDKVRYDRLCRVTEKAVEQTVKNLLNPDHLEKCFPTISNMEGGQAALETARKQMLKYFKSTCTKQFDYIFEQRDIHRKLDELDEIIQAAHARKESPDEEPLHVDQLTPEQLINARIGTSRTECVNKLQMIYSQLLLDNEQLLEQIKRTVEEGALVKKDIVSLVEALTNGIDDVKKQDFTENYDALLEDIFSD